MSTTLELGRLTWRFERNADPCPPAAGEDRFYAWCEEFPGLREQGPTIEEAVKRAESLAAAEIARIQKVPKPHTRKTIQMNVRVSAAAKDAIERDADNAGLSLGRYVESRLFSGAAGEASTDKQVRVAAQKSEGQRGSSTRAGRIGLAKTDKGKRLPA